MRRYFSCFSKSPKVPSKQDILVRQPLTIKRPPEDLLEDPLPLSLDELKFLEYKVANRMSFVNGVANRIHSDYLYCMNRKNLSKAVQLQRLYMERVKEVRRLSARLQQINQAMEDIQTLSPLNLPPPALSVRANPIVGRGPSFRKEFSSQPVRIEL